MGGGGVGKVERRLVPHSATKVIYRLKGNVSPEGGRVCANCEGVSSGEGDGSTHFSCQVSKMSASHALKL